MPYAREFFGAVSPLPLRGGPFVLLDDASAGGKGGEGKGGGGKGGGGAMRARL